MPVKLKDIGEREIIDRLRKTFKFTAPQDDCSLIDNGRSYLMITTDSINFKTHVPSGAGLTCKHNHKKNLVTGSGPTICLRYYVD